MFVLILLTIANGYFLVTNISKASVISVSGGTSNTIHFSKSHLFWIPKFNDQAMKLTDPENAEVQFHAWLGAAYGGWSRWEAKGGEGVTNREETGWFYLVSAPKNKPDGGVAALLNHLNGFFTQSAFYIVEIPHM